MNRPLRTATFYALLLATGLVIAAPAVAQTALSEGRSVRGSLAPGDTARYTVEVGEDYFVFGEVNQISVDVVIRILGIEGDQLGRVDGPTRGIERLSGELNDAGTYTIEVLPVDDEAGDYEIVLHRVEPMATDPRRLTEQLMMRYDGDDTPGAAVQVWRDGRTVYSESWGMANLAYGLPFETSTRTNIGSTSKQFTAFAVMLQAERGALSLDDDIRDHIPELPEFEAPITVRHLITHTSGLREIFNLLLMTGRRIDHGDFIERDEILEVVQAQPKLQNSPGGEWNYNNTAFALAAMIVERTSGKDFPTYMQDNVFGPLGMNSTMVRPHAEAIVPNHSQGYAPGDEGFTEIRDLSAAVGAGAIYSTVGDLQTWVENYANPDPVVGSPEIFSQMMTSFVMTDGEETGYGYGLFIDEQGGRKRIHHGGADIAHRSMLAYYPEINAGITTQSNHASFNSNVAFRLAEAFFSDAIESADGGGGDDASGFDPESYDPSDFDELAGRYALDAAPAFILTFSREDDTFYTQATGQQRIEIVPTSDSTFALTVVEASVVFHRNEDGAVDALTLNQNGQQRATRLTDDQAAAWAPTTDELQAFVGRYFSEEIETFFDIELGEDGLVAKQRRLPDAELEPGEEGEFSGNDLTFTFERDRNDRVIGMYLDNARTRDVRFERVR